MPRPPEHRPPAPLLIAWVTEDRHALVVGGGSVNTRRVATLLEAAARVTVVAPHLSPALESRADRGEIAVRRRRFRPSDLDGVDLVLAAVDDPGASKQISECCRTNHIPVHVADIPALCDFYFAASARRGSVQIAVSTGGSGPVLAARLRDRLEAALPAELARAVAGFAILRAAVRRAVPGLEMAKARMGWLKDYGRRAAWRRLAEIDHDRAEELARRAEEELHLG